MSADLLFDWAGRTALVGWALLVFAPRWRRGTDLVVGVLIPALLAGLYVSLLAVHMRPGGEGGFGSLAQVAAFFEDPWLLLAGWVHYLAFDLFIGAWEVRDARRIGLSHLALLPCLALTFLLGPAGLLLYLALRSARLRRLSLTTEGGATDVPL